MFYSLPSLELRATVDNTHISNCLPSFPTPGVQVISSHELNAHEHSKTQENHWFLHSRHFAGILLMTGTQTGTHPHALVTGWYRSTALTYTGTYFKDDETEPGVFCGGNVGGLLPSPTSMENRLF